MTEDHDRTADRSLPSTDAKLAAVRLTVSEPLRAAGYEPYDTGGGWAWRLQLNPDEEVWITSHDSLDGDPDTQEWLVRRSHVKGGSVTIDTRFPLHEAIDAGPRIRPAKLDDGAPIKRVYPTLEAASVPPGELWHGKMNVEGDEISIVKSETPEGVKYIVRGHDREGAHTYDIEARPTWGSARAFLCRYTGNIACPDLAEPGVDDGPGTPPRRIQLTCSCCLGPAPALIQWWNRDAGYGLCGTCAKWIQSRPNHDPEEFRRSYGFAHLHWFPADPQAV